MKSDIEICKDERGKYVRLSSDFATKKYQGSYGSTRRDVRAGRIQDASQVLFIKMTMQHLHPDCPRLFQSARQNYSPLDAVRYCKAPLGKFFLDKMMTR